MTMNTPPKQPSADTDNLESGSRERAWLNLDRKHETNATRRHSLFSFSNLFGQTFNSSSLSRPEKIALTSIASIFLGFVLWACFWLKQKNDTASGAEVLQTSAQGAYATISNFSSYWKRCENTAGINMEAVAVPAATITLAKTTAPGALRIYFRDHNDGIVGDPVTLALGENMIPDSGRIEITATDGFHNMVDFESYQLGGFNVWRIEILESKGEMEPKENFSPLFQSIISNQIGE